MRLRQERTRARKTVRAGRLVKKVRGNLANLHAEDVYAAAKDGDALSLQLVRELGRLNAIGFANVVNAYDPALITVGGTVASKNEKLVLPLIREHVEEYSVNRVPKIIMKPLGEDIGIRGGDAAAVAFSSAMHRKRSTPSAAPAGFK